MIPEPQIPLARTSSGGSSVFHLLFVNDLETDLLGLFIDDNLFNRSWSSTHSEFHLSALKGRAGGAGCGDQLLPIAQNELAIRSDINDQFDAILIIGFFGNQNPYIVRTDKTRPRWEGHGHKNRG